MPGMSGTELAERLRISRPKMKTLFMSGYSSEAILQRGDVGMRAPLIGKPFTHEELSRAIREVLDAGAPHQGSARHAGCLNDYA
jgi:CheY-like chemotaxis protein